MVQRFLPFILSIIGFPIIFVNAILPIFEWQISETVTDFPSPYKVSVSESPWGAQIGDLLNNKSFVFGRISVSKNGKACSTSELNLVVKRSRTDEFLERLSLALLINDNTIHPVVEWILIQIALSVAYILWFTIWQEHRPILHAIVLAAFATLFFCFIMIPMSKLMGPRIGDIFAGRADCQGIITFSAQLLKVNYSVPILLIVGILAELTALAMMLYQVVKALGKRKGSSTVKVG